MYKRQVLLHLSVFALAATLTAWSWSRARDGHWPIPVRARRRRWAALLLALAAFVVLRYLPLATGAASGTHVPSEFAETPAFYWSVVLLDLGVVVPAALAAAAVALRGNRVALPATYAVVGWFALVPPSVAAMAVVMLARGDSNASVPTTVLMLAVAAVTTTVAAHMFRELLRQQALEVGVDTAETGIGPAEPHVRT